MRPQESGSNSVEFFFEGDMKVAAPLVEMQVTFLNETDDSGNQTVTNVSAVSSDDIVLTVSLILNRKWNKVFVKTIAVKSPRSDSRTTSVTFRPNFKCRQLSLYSLCQTLSRRLSDNVFPEIEANMEQILKFSFEEIEPSLT